MDYYEICGYGAGVLFASGFIPQIYKSYKTKNMDDISFAWQFIFLLGVIFGIIYSIHKDLPPIYICSSIELVFMLILIAMKAYYGPSLNSEKWRAHNKGRRNAVEDISMDAVEDISLNV